MVFSFVLPARGQGRKNGGQEEPSRGEGYSQRGGWVELGMGGVAFVMCGPVVFSFA